MELNNIYNEDILDFLSKVENNSIDLIVADPPYNQKIGYWDTFKNEETYFNFMKNWLDVAIDKLKDTGSIYLFNNAYNSAILIPYLVQKGLNFKNSIIWYKKDGFSPSKKKYVNNQETILFFTKSDKYTFNYDDIRMEYNSKDRLSSNKGILKKGKRWFPNPNGKLCTDVWEYSSVRHTTKVNGKIIKTNHPTPKPKEMIERIIKASSNENDLVLDLFSGSGITSLVCIEHNRFFLGCEKDLNYFNLIQSKITDIKGEI